uniref:Uncharacterized protein n=1 Tax=Panagrolaimus superbus TaxID=310955 RepID=A0A914YNW6_9BILA
MPKSKIARPRNDGTDEEYDSDVSIPVFHPILEYAEISDVEDAMPEPEQDFQLPGSSRPRRKCVKIRAKKPPKKIRKVNSRSSNECFIRHESPTPFFEHVQGQYFDRLMLALPQFHYPVPAPFKTAYSRWEELPFDNKILPNYEPISYDVALEKFRSLRNGIEIPHASTLIIGDSILSSCNFEEKLDSTISIMITFPNKAIDFADAFIRKVQTNADDFSFHNVVIALGIEFICYDPDEKAIVHASREFILKLLRAFHNHFTSKPYVRFILVTVPHVQHNTRTCTYSGHIDYYNKHIRKFVFKYAEEIKEKWNIEFCLFDWEKESNLFKETTIEHVNERYQILLNEISKFTSSTD